MTILDHLGQVLFQKSNFKILAKDLHTPPPPPGWFVAWAYQCINYVVAILEQTRWTKWSCWKTWHVTQLALNGQDGAWTHNLIIISMISEMPSLLGHIHKKGGDALVYNHCVSHIADKGGGKVLPSEGCIPYDKKVKSIIYSFHKSANDPITCFKG